MPVRPDLHGGHDAAPTRPARRSSPASASPASRRRCTTAPAPARTTDYRDVDSWHLDQSFPDPGDGSAAGLWLKSIQHTGKDGHRRRPAAGHLQRNPAAQPRRHHRRRHRRPSSSGGCARSLRRPAPSLTVNYSDPDCVAGTSMPRRTRHEHPPLLPGQVDPAVQPHPGHGPQAAHRLVPQVRRHPGHRVRPDRRRPAEGRRTTPTAAPAGLALRRRRRRSPGQAPDLVASGAATARSRRPRATPRAPGPRRSPLLPRHGRRQAVRRHHPQREKVTDSTGDAIDRLRSARRPVRETITYNGEAPR